MVEIKGPPLPILLKGKVLSMSTQQPSSEVRDMLAVEGEIRAQGRKDPLEKERTALVESLLGSACLLHKIVTREILLRQFFFSQEGLFYPELPSLLQPQASH